MKVHLHSKNWENNKSRILHSLEEWVYAVLNLVEIIVQQNGVGTDNEQESDNQSSLWKFGNIIYHIVMVVVLVLLIFVWVISYAYYTLLSLKCREKVTVKSLGKCWILFDQQGYITTEYFQPAIISLMTIECLTSETWD